MSADPAPDCLREGRRLLAAVEARLGEWVSGALRSRSPSIDDGEVSRVRSLVAAEVLAPLEALLTADIDDQRDTPLAIVRRGTAPMTSALRAGGIAAARRDPMEQRMEPADPYGFGPRGWSELGDDVADAAIRWGAAKAFVHRRRHQP